MSKRLAFLLASLFLAASTLQADTVCVGRGCPTSVPAIGALQGFRIFIPGQTDLFGSVAFGTGGANLTYAAGADCQSDPLPGSDPWNGKFNTFFGINAGDATTCGAGNTFLGHLAGRLNTIGSQNTFVGWGAGQANTSGYHSTYIGTGAGQNNQTCSLCVAVGTDANLTGNGGGGITIVGASAGSNISGDGNTMLGYGTGQVIGTGVRNTAVGYSAFHSLANVHYGIAIGAMAGYYETVGYRLFIDDLDRGSEAASRTASPIVGMISANLRQQALTFNASTITNGSLAFPMTADATIQFGQTVMPDAGTDGRFDATTGSGTNSIGVLGWNTIGASGSPYAGPSAAGSSYQVIYGGLAYVAPAEDQAITRGHFLLQSATAGYCSDSATVSTAGLNIAKALYSEAVSATINPSGCTGGLGCINTALNTPSAGPAGQITLAVDVAALGWAIGDPVIYWNSGGTTPTGLTDGKVYFLASVSTTKVTMATTTVSAVTVPSTQGDDATQYLQRLPLAAISIQ